ncbi:hypothetical protein QO002_004626 [Pararhizobium capsulatum DSM 1112]|uniref:Uncharacterized protein n=1 Tax=Pararhizobium capsulatum DSM 1112 TaxID=1121113 RepID=A0ABU0BVY2_9HYPH|nr:hypothetical protein [Pararhizobium capsulatum]MDQ0322420.1 hypothetical protein [Pararhizobium capsulatum DSM 1112]
MWGFPGIFTVTRWFCPRSCAVSVRRTHFRALDWPNLWDALHLIDHDTVDHLRIALFIDEELADSTIPRPYVGEETLKVGRRSVRFGANDDIAYGKWWHPIVEMKNRRI